jgi:hypothetical protein
MITASELRNIREENNINMDEYYDYLKTKTKNLETYIDNALETCAKNNKDNVSIKFDLKDISSLFAIYNLCKEYKKNDIIPEIIVIDYYSKNNVSIIDKMLMRFSDEESIKFMYNQLFIDLYHVFFDLRDEKLQYKMFKNNNLFFDKMNVALHGAYIKNVTIKFSF